MKATTLKRLDALEQVANQASRPPLCLFEAHRLPPDDRAAFWAGDDAVLTRHGLTDEADSPNVRVVVISIHPEARDKWRETAGMDDAGLEIHEQREILNEQLREREAAERERAALDAAKEQRPRAIWRYEPDGTPIYDDDPRLAHLFKNRT